VGFYQTFKTQLSVLRMLLSNTRQSTTGEKGKTDEGKMGRYSSETFSEPPVTRSSLMKRKSEQFQTPAAKIIRRCVDARPEDTGDEETDRLQEEEDPARPSPIPPIKFADGFGLWELMCETDKKYVRSADPFRNHPILSPQMRAILLDWMMDVCEAYNLHRETLYLSIDFLDRYLSAEQNLRKDHLQLIGSSQGQLCFDLSHE